MRDLTSESPTRSPGYLLWLIEWLPDDGAFAASLRGGHDHYGWGTDRHMVADQWDVDVAIGMAGSKKKPPHYPRPGTKKKSGGVPLMSLMPKRRPPPEVELPPPPRPGPRVAGQKKRG